MPSFPVILVAKGNQFDELCELPFVTIPTGSTFSVLIKAMGKVRFSACCFFKSYSHSYEAFEKII